VGKPRRVRNKERRDKQGWLDVEELSLAHLRVELRIMRIRYLAVKQALNLMLDQRESVRESNKTVQRKKPNRRKG